MKKRKVISSKNTNIRPPLLLTAVTYLFLDKFDAPEWLWGALALFFVILWIVFIADKTEDVDIFEEPKEGEEKKKSFRERLIEKMRR